MRVGYVCACRLLVCVSATCVHVGYLCASIRGCTQKCVSFFDIFVWRKCQSRVEQRAPHTHSCAACACVCYLIYSFVLDLLVSATFYAFVLVLFVFDCGLDFMQVLPVCIMTLQTNCLSSCVYVSQFNVHKQFELPIATPSPMQLQVPVVISKNPH